MDRLVIGYQYDEMSKWLHEVVWESMMFFAPQIALAS